MLAPQPIRSDVAFAGGSQPRDEQPPLLVESDLSAETAVGDDELDAIIRSATRSTTSSRTRHK